MAGFISISSNWIIFPDSSLDKSQEIRSSVGINLDWFSAIGPLSFSLSQPITKSSSDKTQSFRFIEIGVRENYSARRNGYKTSHRADSQKL